MGVDNSKVDHWLREQESRKRASMDDLEDPPLKGGGGDGTYTGMEGRVSKLEAYMDVTRDDLREIKGALNTLISTVNTLPTKTDLNSWRWQWIVTAIAIITLTVGGITGGLALIAHYN